jgi:hypothetical protein
MASTKKTHDPSSPADRSLADKATTFRRCKTIEEIAAEQGVPLPQDLDSLIGQGKDLWSSDEEFEAWLKELNEARREGR